MEMILGVIEDILERFENGSSSDKEDATNELKLNIAKFKSNLTELAGKGNQDAKGLLEKLEKTGIN